MTAQGNSLEEKPLVNIDKLEKLLSIYKFPLILTLIGLVLFFLAFGLLIKRQGSPSDIEFISEATQSATSKIRVDIGGEVINPGVYELEEGSRIQDALTVAGGLSVNADRNWISKNLNRAAKLIDGGKIYIPSLSEASEGKFQISNDKLQISPDSQLLGVTAGLININTASSKELESIKGIGPVTAQKIIDGRPYSAVAELKERKIVGQSLYEKVKDLLTVY